MYEYNSITKVCFFIHPDVAIGGFCPFLNLTTPCDHDNDLFTNHSFNRTYMPPWLLIGQDFTLITVNLHLIFVYKLPINQKEVSVLSR